MDNNMVNNRVVHSPRHLARPPERALELPEYMERKYEIMFGEPWAALEERVLAGHPEYAEMMRSIEMNLASQSQKKWWQIWK